MSNEIELVDLVDASGKIQKKGVARDEIEKYPSLHLQIAIAVAFNPEGKVLVQRRALTKNTCPGDLDHTCGALKSGETPEVAIHREALEETGLTFYDLKIVDQSLNSYSRYRYLLVARADGEPKGYDLGEVEWVKFISPEELKEGKDSGELSFVREFFEDMKMALKSSKR